MSLTYQDVAEHNTKKDLYMVIHGKVYDATPFVDEHPGGEEVLLDVGGQDATEAFEDVGHSDEARETLEKLLVGDLKRQAGDPVPKVSASSAPKATNASTDSTSSSLITYAVVVAGGALAYFAYGYLQSQQKA
ncbi:cytochrome b5-like heme/steroid binding domain-containing protein [Stachybotrys elegans]|uniref:Cytochrome b5-like heme/steroid binding domain-containing protein n=1 Tax=Stachybotrys elegans TaxID=80388 RepID=A0A8K0SMH0_9HYPO|nr:cytochrome b5-like heme/steroid binding domain-containing protein [Stachybotrys elegans]